MDGIELYDVGIIGGGLAGLSLSILMAKEGYSVVLFEKESYPFHKVCGEYISMESWGFLERLGVILQEKNLPKINTLHVTALNGKKLTADISPGGFGISRYLLDNELSILANNCGVKVLVNTKVDGVDAENGRYLINTSVGKFQSKICVGSFGKRSNLDIKWGREFVKTKPSKLNNYVGIKYHIETGEDENCISLHNFRGGYCGISKVEGNKYTLCYLTTAQNLKTNNSIEQMERNVLYENAELKRILTSCTKDAGFPLTISQISFDKKNLIDHEVIMTGDAAGMITPLCGNGMSMALHSSKILAGLLSEHLSHKISFESMCRLYTKQWRSTFGRRVKVGRIVQRFLGRTAATSRFISILNAFPILSRALIRTTHGAPF